MKKGMVEGQGVLPAETSNESEPLRVNTSLDFSSANAQSWNSGVFGSANAARPLQTAGGIEPLLLCSCN